MISFKDYLNKFEKKFVSLNFTKETNKFLFDYAIKNGFDLSAKYDGTIQAPEEFRFHTTIYYTVNRLNAKNETISLDQFKVEPDHLELLGADKNIPVLKLKNKGHIKKLRNIFTEQGYRDTWPDYKPHISLSYNKKAYNLNKISLPVFDIVADSFTVEKQ